MHEKAMSHHENLCPPKKNSWVVVVYRAKYTPNAMMATK